MIKPLFQKILVAINGSTDSLHAAMYAIMMSKLYHSKVKVVYVVDTAAIKQLTLSKFLASGEGESVQKGLEGDGNRNLEYVANIAKSKGVKVETELREGAVGVEIINAADQFKADVILLGAKLHSDASAFIHDDIGLEARKIMSNAHCSVLLVKQQAVEQLFKLA